MLTEVRLANPTIEYGCIFIANHLATEEGKEIVRFCQEADYVFHNPLMNRKKWSEPSVAIRGSSENSVSTSPQSKTSGSSPSTSSINSREVRSDFKEEFESTIKKINAADVVIQLAIGVGINLAFSLFRQKFSTPQAFRALNTKEQLSYLENLAQMEDRLRVEKGDVAASMGFWLFKAWVGTLVANDDKLERQCFAELSRFSQMAEGEAR